MTHNENRANGIASGKDKRMVNGCTVLSNCEARIMYMKITDNKNAHKNSFRFVPVHGHVPIHWSNSWEADSSQPLRPLALPGDPRVRNLVQQRRAGLPVFAGLDDRSGKHFRQRSIFTTLSNRTRPPSCRGT